MSDDLYLSDSRLPFVFLCAVSPVTIFLIGARQGTYAVAGKLSLCYTACSKDAYGDTRGEKARALPLERKHETSGGCDLCFHGDRHSICLRVLAKFDIGGPAVNHIRSALYLLLFALWGFSLDRRIIQRQALHCLRLTAALILLWLILRTLKYSVVTGLTAARYVWYLYYLPMLFLPLLGCTSPCPWESRRITV